MRKTKRRRENKSAGLVVVGGFIGEQFKQVRKKSLRTGRRGSEGTTMRVTDGRDCEGGCVAGWLVGWLSR